MSPARRHLRLKILNNEVANSPPLNQISSYHAVTQSRGAHAHKMTSLRYAAMWSCVIGFEERKFYLSSLLVKFRNRESRMNKCGRKTIVHLHEITLWSVLDTFPPNKLPSLLSSLESWITPESKSQPPRKIWTLYLELWPLIPGNELP